MRYLSLTILVMFVSAVPLHGYITSGLPPQTHQAWLKKLTSEICKSQPGDMTCEMLSTVPELMSAWAQNPYITPLPSSPSLTASSVMTTSNHGKMCALTVERLLKRLVDERRAGNTNAVATTKAYNAAINGWARSGEAGAAQRAEQVSDF